METLEEIYNLDDVYKHLSNILHRLDYLEELGGILKGIVAHQTQTLKEITPRIKEMVETFDGNTHVLSKNIMPRLAELERSLIKKKGTSKYA